MMHVSLMHVSTMHVSMMHVSMMHIPNNQILNQVVPSVGQICNYYKWHHLVAKFATNASGDIWWPYLQLMQDAPSHGQIYN